jgi:phosphate butyryltransferase
MVSEAARIKGFDCPCSGDFDMLFVPNILVGNILGKCLVYSAKGKMAGLILGAKVPIVLTSRGATAEEKYNSIAIAAGV